MRVKVLGKTAFDREMKRAGINDDNVESRSECFISINDTCGTPEVPYFQNHSNVLVLFFDDTEQDVDVPKIGTSEVFKIKAFTKGQAEQILDFIQANRDKKACIVHCAAGISRSGAVGEFINDYFGGNFFDFKKDNPHTLPNQHVIIMLKATLRENHKQ